MVIVSSLSPVLAAAFARLATRLSAVVRALENRQAVQDMAQLDDRMLKDIGLTRTDVRGALEVSLLDDPSHVLADIAGAGHGAASRQANLGVRRPMVITPRVEDDRAWAV
jgi:uncharacterized protein YjiS (DUF1127 family)